MPTDTYAVINKQLEIVSYRRHQLIIICGQTCSGILQGYASASNIPYVNLSLELSKALLEIPVSLRWRKVGPIVDQIIKEQDSNIICFDHLELLFHPQLHQDPMRLLENISRNTTIIAGWNGSYENGTLTYAAPGHQEFRSYTELEASIITVE
ncbi:MAG: hypothetical protein PWQ96_1592 [Clostridia bacterium]|jgi:hypothetical protein|nr:hypothetical protein [Clostridiales bacterium]MDK2985949.1 hypothetical protein [Clostridia bacterium]